MTNQCYRISLKIGILLCLFTLGLIASSMKMILSNSDDLLEINVNHGFAHSKEERNHPKVVKSKDNEGMETVKDKLPEAVMAITRTNEQRERYPDGNTLPTVMSSNHFKEIDSENATVGELLVARGRQTYATREMDKLNTEKVALDDQRLVKLIRDHFIVAPSNQPYNLSDMSILDTSMGQAAFVDNRLKFKEKGFFFESGAHDGEYLSNTLYLERTRHWSGVLIEPLPDAFEALMKKHRKAYAINSCLSLHSYPSMEYLSTTPVIGKIVHATSFSQRYDQEKKVRVQCFPLYSILLALNRTHVDFLSLDIEGVEQYVLDTIPWDKLDIEMLAVEFDKWPGGRDALIRYMERRGYDWSMTLQAHGAADNLFKKRH